MHKGVLFLVAPVILGGCAGYGGPSAATPDQTEILTANYMKLAECSYGRLDREFSSMLKKADLPSSSTVRIYADGSGVRYWELAFIKQAESRTRVEFFITKNMWGLDASGAANRVMPEVKACAA